MCLLLLDVSQRSGWCSPVNLAGRYTLTAWNPALCTDDRMVVNPAIVGDTHLPSNNGVVADSRASCDTGLRGDDGVVSHAHVVRDLTEVVDL